MDSNEGRADTTDSFSPAAGLALVAAHLRQDDAAVLHLTQGLSREAFEAATSTAAGVVFFIKQAGDVERSASAIDAILRLYPTLGYEG